jgi:hypothetical protein
VPEKFVGWKPPTGSYAGFDLWEELVRLRRRELMGLQATKKAARDKRRAERKAERHAALKKERAKQAKEEEEEEKAELALEEEAAAGRGGEGGSSRELGADGETASSRNLTGSQRKLKFEAAKDIADKVRGTLTAL